VSIAPPWNRQAAHASLRRWQELCEREGWGCIPTQRDLLLAVFGASWYCTRFLFYRGREAAALLQPPFTACQGETVRRRLLQLGEAGPPALEALRVARNEVLLAALAADLRGTLPQEALEQALTELAVATLEALLAMFRHRYPVLERLVVLGMGRMAGGEMNYGSDLDLILLHPDASAIGDGKLSAAVHGVLRHCATTSPAGSLYAIDMRLRPHGAAGTLVSSLPAFREHHLQARETWERQLMTRCRLLRDPEGYAQPVLHEVRAAVYARHDAATLRDDVRRLRRRVVRELGSRRNRFDLKRDDGGLMDIDFASHYLQLAHGADHPELCVAGTRRVLRAAAAGGLLGADSARRLLDGYAWLKRVEGCVRAFDMQAQSHLSSHPPDLLPPARAMGRLHDDAEQAVAAFLHDLRRVTGEVHDDYLALLS